MHIFFLYKMSFSVTKKDKISVGRNASYHFVPFRYVVHFEKAFKIFKQNLRSKHLSTYVTGVGGEYSIEEFSCTIMFDISLL